LFAKADNSFPFYDLLTSIPPAIVEGNNRMYFAGANPTIDSEKIIHFAMGVFWKAAVHPWIPRHSEPLIDLGEYANPIREYLRGELPFPNDIVLMMGILTAPVKHLAISAPYRGSNATTMNFLFYALGMEFSILVGSTITNEHRTAALSWNRGRPIMVADFSPLLREMIADTTKTAHKAKNVQKYLNKR
jgi:hypothetical protein